MSSIVLALSSESVSCRVWSVSESAMGMRLMWRMSPSSIFSFIWMAVIPVSVSLLSNEA